MSLDRLIDLAKRTGDRLIVHDPIMDRDIVIMDLDSYEKLVFGNQASDFDDDNDDIDFFDDGMRTSGDDPWHHAGSVLEDRYGSDRWSDDSDDEEDKEGNSFPCDKGADASHLADISTDDVTETPPAHVPAPEVVPIHVQGEQQTQLPVSDEPVFYEEPV